MFYYLARNEAQEAQSALEALRPLVLRQEDAAAGERDIGHASSPMLGELETGCLAEKIVTSALGWQTLRIL